MNYVKIQDLPEITSTSSTTYAPVIDGASSRTSKIKYSNLVKSANNITTTTEGYVLDARQGKALDDKITGLSTVYAPKTNPAGGQNNYAPLSNPEFTGIVNVDARLRQRVRGDVSFEISDIDGSIYLNDDIGETYAKTQISTDNSTKLATTAFVQAQKSSPTFTGTVKVGNTISVPDEDFLNITSPNWVSSGKGLSLDVDSSHLRHSSSQSVEFNEDGTTTIKGDLIAVNPTFTGNVDMDGATTVTVPTPTPGTNQAATALYVEGLIPEVDVKFEVIRIPDDDNGEVIFGETGMVVNHAYIRNGETQGEGMYINTAAVGSRLIFKMIGNYTTKLLSSTYCTLDGVNIEYNENNVNGGYVLEGDGAYIYVLKVGEDEWVTVDKPVTKSDIGLGNVTNESKSTMFTSPTFTGNVVVPDGDATNEAVNKGQLDLKENILKAPLLNTSTTLILAGTYGVILCYESSASVTLPVSSVIGAGKVYTIKNVHSTASNVNIKTSYNSVPEAETLDGVDYTTTSSYVLAKNNAIVVISDGLDGWHIISKYTI